MAIVTGQLYNNAGCTMSPTTPLSPTSGTTFFKTSYPSITSGHNTNTFHNKILHEGRSSMKFERDNATTTTKRTSNSIMKYVIKEICCAQTEMSHGFIDYHLRDLTGYSTATA